MLRGMDTLTHALSGALMARLLHVRSPASVASQATSASRPPLWAGVLAGTVAGAFPDVDIVARWWGDVAYLLNHRGVTHSLLLAPLWAALVAWVLAWVLRRWVQPPSGVAAATAMTWRSLYGVCLAGILIHIAGDWITQFGTMLWAPLSNSRLGLGTVFIIDLWFTGALLLGLLLAAVWPHRRWPAALGLGLATAWVGVTWVGQQEALEVGRAQAQALGAPQARVVVMPRPASPFNWTVAVQHEGRYHLAHVNTRRTQPLALTPDSNWIQRLSAPYLPASQAPWQVLEQWGGPDAPAWVRQAWDHPSFAFYRWFAGVPALSHTTQTMGADGRTERCAWFRDLRFGFPGRDGTPFHYGLCLQGEGVGDAQVYRLQGGQRHPV
jgi:inner membrane protein